MSTAGDTSGITDGDGNYGSNADGNYAGSSNQVGVGSQPLITGPNQVGQYGYTDSDNVYHSGPPPGGQLLPGGTAISPGATGGLPPNQGLNNAINIGSGGTNNTLMNMAADANQSTISNLSKTVPWYTWLLVAGVILIVAYKATPTL